MWTIDNFKFLHFEIAIKVASLYLMFNTAKIMTYTE